jgi:hypothetical protein
MGGLYHNFNMMRKNFIVRNEEFSCLKCGHVNPPLEGSCRNHCQKCLHSLHVDDVVPGDRESSCHGLMMPISLDYSGKKGYSVVHECMKCGCQMHNKVADDDDQDRIVQLSTLH